MTPQVEDLVKVLSDLLPPDGEVRHAHTLFNSRLHLARGPGDRLELLLEGDKASFGEGAIGRGLEFGHFKDSNAGRAFDALLVRSTGIPETSLRPMAHLAYEAAQRVSDDPEITNESLVRGLEPFLRLVLSRELLSQEHQVGLTGELLLLRELLDQAAEDGLPLERAVECWVGWDSSTRDFRHGATAVEVKVSQTDRREHWVGSMFQLLPEPGTEEGVFVYSVGLRSDRSRTYNLLTEIDRVLERLEPALKERFLSQLSQYGGVGLNLSDRSRYELEPGLLVVKRPALVRVDNLQGILRPESFVEGEPPARVLGIRYRVDLEGAPILSQADRIEVLRRLLGAEEGEKRNADDEP